MVGNHKMGIRSRHMNMGKACCRFCGSLGCSGEDGNAYSLGRNCRHNLDVHPMHILGLCRHGYPYLPTLISKDL